MFTLTWSRGVFIKRYHLIKCIKNSLQINQLTKFPLRSIFFTLIFLKILIEEIVILSNPKRFKLYDNDIKNA